MMRTAPIPATRRVLAKTGLAARAIDHFEVNEAFACVPLAWQREFAIDPARLNPCGGAIAIGHPLGASGARLMTTMLHALERSGGRYGLQTMCEAGGMRSEEHTSELQSLMRISYAVFCLKKKHQHEINNASV